MIKVGNYKFVHSCIRVLDLEESVNFYKEALDLKVASKRDFPEGEFTLVYLEDEQSDFQLELTYNYDQKEPYTIGDGYSHIAVTVANLEESHRKHKEMGYEVTDLTSLSDSGGGYYFLTDPDGYDIEVIQG